MLRRIAEARKGCYSYESAPCERVRSRTLSSIMGRDPVEHAKRAKYQPPAMRVRGVCYTKKSPFHL